MLRAFTRSRCSAKKIKKSSSALLQQQLITGERMVPIKYTSDPRRESRRDAISGLLAIPSFFVHINTTSTKIYTATYSAGKVMRGHRDTTLFSIRATLQRRRVGTL